MRLSIIILVFVLLSPSLSFFINVSQKCTSFLPYGSSNININDYMQWYGKVGKSLNGTSYLPGHVFSKHIAIGGKCTDEQKSENKTVFLNASQFFKILKIDNTNCTLASATDFNFDAHQQISSASNYISGIDCKTGQIQSFSKYFTEYKRAVKNERPTQGQYMASQYVTINTMYPQR